MDTIRWFLYDGDCGFCSACARFIERHIRTDARVVAWQFADIEALGVTATACDQAVQWVVTGPVGRREVAVGPAAIAALLGRGGVLARSLGWLLRTWLMSRLARPVYDFVARHRDRMPGGTATCALPANQRN